MIERIYYKNGPNELNINTLIELYKNNSNEISKLKSLANQYQDEVDNTNININEEFLIENILKNYKLQFDQKSEIYSNIKLDDHYRFNDSYKNIIDPDRIKNLDLNEIMNAMIKLTNDDFRFLLGNEIEGFGWEEDPRIHEILQKNVLTDKKLVLEFSKNEDVLGYASEELKNDKETVLQVIKSNSDRHVFKGASEELRNDRETVLEAVRRNGLALEYVSEELRNDREIVLEAIKNDGLALCYASEELKNDKKVVLEAMKNDSFAVRWAGKELLNDREFILAVVKENRYVLQYASDELQNDKKFVLAAVKDNPVVMRQLWKLDNELRNDKEFMSEVRKFYDEYHRNNDGKGSRK